MNTRIFPTIINQRGTPDILELETAEPGAALYRCISKISGRIIGIVVMRYREHLTSYKFPSGAEVIAGDFQAPSISDFGLHGWQYSNDFDGREKALDKLAEHSALNTHFLASSDAVLGV